MDSRTKISIAIYPFIKDEGIITYEARLQRVSALIGRKVDYEDVASMDEKEVNQLVREIKNNLKKAGLE